MKFADLTDNGTIIATKKELNEALGGVLAAHEIFQQLDDNVAYFVEFKDTGEEFLINLEYAYDTKIFVEPPKLKGKVI